MDDATRYIMRGIPSKSAVWFKLAFAQSLEMAIRTRAQYHSAGVRNRVRVWTLGPVCPNQGQPEDAQPGDSDLQTSAVE